MARLRRAGNPWRILVHTVEPQGRSGDAHHVSSDRRFGGGTGEDRSVEVDGKTFHARSHELSGTEFDELVVGRWIHLEQMDAGVWWMNVGGVTLSVRADRDGRPKHVTVYGPGAYDDPVDGVEYELAWTRDEGGT